MITKKNIRGMTLLKTFLKEGKDGTRTEFWKRLNQYGFHIEDRIL